MPQAAPNDSPGWARPVAWVIAAAVFGFLCAGSLGRAGQLLWPFGVDGAYFLQRAWLGGHAPFDQRTLLTNEIGRGAFGGRHHSPLIGLFVPVAGVFRSYGALLAAQAAVLALGVIPLFALCWQAAGDRVTALVLLLAALSVPGFFEIPVTDFRLVTPALVLVPAAIGGAVFGSWPYVLAATVACCAVREGCAPVLLAALPWLVWERQRRSAAPRAWVVPVLAMGIPALLWMVGTEWRAGLYPGHRGLFDDQELHLGGLATWWVELFASDLRGERGDSILGLRLLRVVGAGSLLFLLRPLAVLPLGLYWFAAILHSGMINPGQTHYFAPLVGVGMALIPLSLTGPGLQRRWRLGVAASVLVVNLFAAPLQGPIRPLDAAARLGAPIPEAALAADIGPDEAVLASDWLLPTVPARARLWSTTDLGGHLGAPLADVDVVLLARGDAWESTLRAAGFHPVVTTRHALVLRRTESR